MILAYYLKWLLFLDPYSSEMVEVPNEADVYGPIDSIPYKGGPISLKDHSEFRRQYFADGHKLAMRKKKDGNDDSESDNSDGSDTRPCSKRKVKVKPKACVPDDSMTQNLAEGASSMLVNVEDSDCILIPVKKRVRVSSKPSDGVVWSGIQILSLEKLFEETYGESINGRMRVKLYAQKKLLRMRALLVALFKCSTEDELLALLRSSIGEQFKFEFYYQSEGYLYSCINPDGLCGPRNFAVLQKGDC